MCATYIILSLSLRLPRDPQTGLHLPIASFFSQLGLGLLEASSVLLPRALYFEAWFLSESFPTVDWIIPRTPLSLSPSPLSPLSAESYLYSSWHASPQESVQDLCEPHFSRLTNGSRGACPAQLLWISSAVERELLCCDLDFLSPGWAEAGEVYEAGKPPRNAKCREVPSNGY